MSIKIMEQKREAIKKVLMDGPVHMSTNAEVIISWLVYNKCSGHLLMPSIDEMRESLYYTRCQLKIAIDEEPPFVESTVDFVGKEKAKKLHDFLYSEDEGPKQ